MPITKKKNNTIKSINRKKSFVHKQNNYSNDTNITKEINLKIGNTQKKKDIILQIFLIIIIIILVK